MRFTLIYFFIRLPYLDFLLFLSCVALFFGSFRDMLSDDEQIIIVNWKIMNCELNTVFPEEKFENTRHFRQAERAFPV